jgi:two-component system chemotaxis sensor kinase CheA
MAIKDELQQQLIKDLLIESAEGLDRFDSEMLSLEKGSASPDTPNIIFRVIHTIKGTAGCLGLTKIESVAHVGENLLSSLREGKVGVSPRLIATLLAYADALRQMLRSLETTQTEGSADYSDLLQQLEALQVCAPLPEETVQPKAAPASTLSSNSSWGLFEPDESLVDEPKGTSIETNTKLTSEPVPSPPNSPPTLGPSVADTAIRVNVDQLDKLMNLVGELVLARNQIVQHCAFSHEHSLIAASQRLNIITTELQEGVMKTRMLPIGNVWAKFPRIVRDVACELGKQVQLVMVGDKTELDRTIIEAIKDPLTHIVRNAIDHGIERPDVRRTSGKAEEGTITLRAFHEGGQVNIEIADDGRGINVTKIKQKGIEKGLLTADAASRMTDREAYNLIFLPGFSTAEKITNVSGRGVGMDVVKTNIEKIGGSVDVLSEDGRGSTIKIKIPLTLAIIPALVVTCGGERFAIPQVSLLELVRLEGEQAKKGIEMLYGAPVYRLRGQLLPLCYLNKELELNLTSSETLDSSDAVNVVILQADGRQFGLVVDEINDTEEIVVKPLGKQLKGIACFAGATIMGDGRVALILDVLGVAQHANVVSEVRDRSLLDKAKSESQSNNRQTLLLFETSKDNRMAIPLSVVARLEEFPRSQVEHSGGQPVVQYRGQILPLIQVSDYVSGAHGHSSEQDPMQVVVYSEHGRSVGLVVGRINDIVEETVTIERAAQSQGILGSIVIQQRVTDLLDVPAVIRSANPTFYAD